MIDRDWSDAVAAHENERCRVCLGWPVDLAHVLPRTYDRRRGAMRHVRVDPLAVVPLCRGHHQMYDHGQLNLYPHLTRGEIEHAFSVIGEIAALRRILGPESRSLPPIQDL